MASSHNIAQPMFGRAPAKNPAEGWSDGDALDFDLLAEYLLDDGNLNPAGVTFDFNIDANSGVVSPENSEDGKLPTVADLLTQQPPPLAQYASTPVPNAQYSQQTQMAAPQIIAGMTMPAAPSVAFPQLAPQVPMQQPSEMSLIYHQHGATDPKRRRVESMPAPMMAVATGQAYGQQLTAAAAQAIQQGGGRSRKKSQAQIDRRRERNRILARRTRLRKKFFFESLQKEVVDLQRENAHLKGVVTEHIDEENAAQILDGCTAAASLPEGVLEACAEENEMDSDDFNLVKSIQGSQHSFVITDPSLQDNPIVFASDDFLKLTGYKREQVLGRNCRFLQGIDTSHEKIESVSKALSNGEDVSVTMINYMADGTPFWNKLFIAALRDAQNNIVNFIGVSVKVATPEPGDSDHGKLLPGQKVDTEYQEDDAADGGHKQAAESTVKAIEGNFTAALEAVNGPY